MAAIPADEGHEPLVWNLERQKYDLLYNYTKVLGYVGGRYL